MMVGGTTWSRMARTADSRFSPPAAAVRWPVIDLTELTASRLASAPKTRLRAIVSHRSLPGVLVP